MSSIMDKTPLELYFDEFIASLQDPSEEDPGEELFIDSIPHELLTLCSQQDAESDIVHHDSAVMFQQHDSAEREQEDGKHPVSQAADMLPGTSASLNYSSQNTTAAISLPEPDEFPVPSVTLEPPRLVPEIQNVISTVNVGCRLDLDFIAHKVWNIEYNPQTFRPLIMRIREPRTTALIYQNGKVVCSGAKSKEESRLAARKHVRILQKLGLPVRFLNFRICNVVGSFRTHPVSLERLQMVHPLQCSYEPELFPGLFYKMVSGINVTVFPSGTVTLSGANTEAEVHRAFDFICPILSSYSRERRNYSSK